MSSIKSRNTKLEVAIRKALFARGFRYRINDKKLPGRPDIVLPKYRAVIFINGCYWHGHDCSIFRWPRTNAEFWYKKINSNKTRDEKNHKQLVLMGWRVVVVWECSARLSGRDPLDIAGELGEWLLGSEVWLEIRSKDV